MAARGRVSSLLVLALFVFEAERETCARTEQGKGMMPPHWLTPQIPGDRNPSWVHHVGARNPAAPLPGVHEQEAGVAPLWAGNGPGRGSTQRCRPNPGSCF